MFQTAFSVGMQVTLVDNGPVEVLRTAPTLLSSKYSRPRSAIWGGNRRAGKYGAWFASKKFLKYGKFTGSDDVWGEGGGNLCFIKWQKVV